MRTNNSETYGFDDPRALSLAGLRVEQLLQHSVSIAEKKDAYATDRH